MSRMACAHPLPNPLNKTLNHAPGNNAAVRKGQRILPRMGHGPPSALIRGLPVQLDVKTTQSDSQNQNKRTNSDRFKFTVYYSNSFTLTSIISSSTRELAIRGGEGEGQSGVVKADDKLSSSGIFVPCFQTFSKTKKSAPYGRKQFNWKSMGEESENTDWSTAFFDRTVLCPPLSFQTFLIANWRLPNLNTCQLATIQ